MCIRDRKARVEEVKNSIDLMDSQAALQYGVGAQRNISSFSDNILTQVRSKDSGYVGELMSDLVLKVKEVDVDGLDAVSYTHLMPTAMTTPSSPLWTPAFCWPGTCSSAWSPGL